MTPNEKAASAVNSDGLEKKGSTQEYNAAGELVNACYWCQGLWKDFPLEGHCSRCGAGYCSLHGDPEIDLCPRCLLIVDVEWRQHVERAEENAEAQSKEALP